MRILADGSDPTSVGPRTRGTPPIVEAASEGEGLISESVHRPLHYYLDNNCYWLSAATLHHQPFFREDARLDLLAQELESSAAIWSVECIAWVIMEHHHHAIVHVANARTLPRFVQRLHGRTARLLNLDDGTPGRQVWRQYWDRLLRTEGDFWSRLNYVWWNPVKHEFCARPEQWRWIRMPAWFSDEDGTNAEVREQFPAPKMLPGDRW